MTPEVGIGDQLEARKEPVKIDKFLRPPFLAGSVEMSFHWIDEPDHESSKPMPQPIMIVRWGLRRKRYRRSFFTIRTAVIRKEHVFVVDFIPRFRSSGSRIAEAEAKRSPFRHD